MSLDPSPVPHPDSTPPRDASAPTVETIAPPAPAVETIPPPAPTAETPPPTAPEPIGATTADAPAAPPPLEPAAPVAHPFVFHGRTDEYFRIWIVNTLLTLLTGGIFLAWAKVRKRRYLRGCTELMGHRFDYRASAPRLLVGHLVMVTLFLGYSLFGAVYPFVRYGVLLLGVAMLPWIVVRSLSFNAHNTVYRGLRFRFHPSLSAAAMLFLAEGLLVVVTFGLYAPAWIRSQRRYVISNHRLGDAYFHFDATAGPFYRAYLFGGGIVVAAAFLGGMVVALMGRNPGGQPPGLVELLPFFAVYAGGFVLSRHYVYAHLFNHVWNHTRLDDHRFVAALSPGRWLGLQLTNMGAIVISAGLLYPWAVIRAHRYAASCLAFKAAGPIEVIQHVGGTGGNATGDTAAEFVGVDFGL